MGRRLWISISILQLVSLAPVAGQSPDPPSRTAAKASPNPKTFLQRTPWGDPDLQGVWNDATSTPLQRPSDVGDKDTLTDAEAAEFQKELAGDLTRDRRDPGTEADVGRAYNEHWMDARRLKITADRRTSLIVDPPDGRIPPLVPLSPERAKARAARTEQLARFGAGLPENYLDATLPVRCIIRTDAPPTSPSSTTTTFRFSKVPESSSLLPR